jgi:alpha-beta hydrolase superfamily lysophospholipase
MFDILPDFYDGEVTVDDVVISREYIMSEEGYHICHTEISHKEEKPKATIAFFHGMGQGSDAFVEFGIQFAMNGFHVEAIDYRGFGQSGGIRCDSPITDCQRDIVALLKEVDSELPLFVYGHSMGALILTSFLMNNPEINVSGVIMSAPLTAPPPNVHLDSARLFLANFLGEQMPELIVSPKINLSAVTKKALILKWYLTSRKVVPAMGMRQTAVLVNYLYHYKYNAKSLEFPILMHLAKDDKIVNNEATKKIFEKFGTEDKQMFEYDDCGHELQFEDCNREVFRNTVNWINNKFKEGNTSNLGGINFDRIKIAFLKRKAPFKHWKELGFFLLAMYYFIGYILMVSKFINKNRHEMIAFWPCSLYRKFFGK